MDAVQDELTGVLDGIVATLRMMPSTKLAAHLRGPTKTRADAGRLLADVLAKAAQGIEEAGSPIMPRWRVVPQLPDLAVGDQVSVLAHDFSLVVSAAVSSEVWTPDGRAPLSDVLRDVAATADEVRRLFP